MTSLVESTKSIQSFMKSHPQINKISDLGPVKGREVSDFYIQLIDCLVDHNHLYYTETAPIISDKEYDELFDYLKKIEEAHPEIITSNSPTQGLIGQISDGFVQAQHEVKLLSLENTYNAKDLKEWDERIRKLLEKYTSESVHTQLEHSTKIFGNLQSKSSGIVYHVEPKFDGLSVELIYKKGVFTQAITRGDGLVGEDITENVKTIKNVPKRLNLSAPDYLSVRGEILMPKSVWKELNREREEDGEIPFANTRNAAAGSIKLLDPKEVARRGLICYVYDILKDGKIKTLKDGKNESIGKQTFDFGLWTKLGLPVFPREKNLHSIEEVIALCENPATKKYLEQQDSEFDGLVIKVRDQGQREMIGTTDHHPRWAVAYKFPAQLAATQILSVDFQVGRTGIITPVANLEPVQLSGAKLQRVSLHNFDFIKEKDIHVHDWIWLQRSGEVIPYIVSVITDRRLKPSTPSPAELRGGNLQPVTVIHPPKTCPSCHTLVEQKEMHYYCKNPHCPGKMKQAIQHFVSKNCMDIQGIGESVIDLLVENKIITTVADIYKLSDINIQIQLLKFPGFGDKKVAEIAKGVEESKHKALRRLLNGLGIPHVGKKMAQDLSEQILNFKFGILNWNVNSIISAISNHEFLESVYGIGEKTIENITDFFNNKNNIHLLEQLEKVGVNMDSQKYSDRINAGEVKGSFSITGSFDISREKIADFFQKNGYIFHESPLKTTDFMLIGEKAGSKKKKAQELGITIYEGRENIVKKFPFLKSLNSKKDNKPITQSLF